MGRLEAGEAPGRESKINLLSLNKLILVVPGRGKAGGWGGTGHKLFLAVPGRGKGRRVPGGWVEAGEAPGVPGRGKAGGWGGTRRGIQNQFVEPQQIDFGGSGPWEGWRLGRHRAGNPKSIC